MGLLTVVALGARLYRLAGPVLRWDEGWSLAHASLPWSQLWRVATEEWHPPLYVALLKLWLVAGKCAWSIRFLSVLLGACAVPLTYQVACAWTGRRRVGVLAAGLAALWPLLVYYGQVTRMYALSALPVLAAAWFALRGDPALPPKGLRTGRLPSPSWRRGNWPACLPLNLKGRGNAADLGLVLSSIVALYTLYPTAWALAGIWLYAAIARPRRIPRLAVAGLATGLAYLPWLLVARTTIQARLGSGAAGEGNAILGTIAYLKPTLEGLAFIYGGAGWRAAGVLAVVLGLGLAVGPWRRTEVAKLLLPLLVVGVSMVGVAYGARSYWFAARHLVPASAFLCLALAWALDRLAGRWWPLLPLALVALAVVYWPTSSRFVYEKMLEVTDPFDPAADRRYLAAHAGPRDLAYFNVLARAGWYESYRRAQDPAWSYAMRWDPIVEPIERIAERIGRDARIHPRLWFVLYKGNYGPNAPLVEWLDANLYPAGGEWQGDMLYLAYAAPPAAWTAAARDDRFELGIRLKAARWSASVEPGGACALELTWQAEQPLTGFYKVFVHATDEAGRPLAQHDAAPVNGALPTDAWPVGAEIHDRHGLLLPAAGEGVPERLHLRVGLYDPNTGQRLCLADGADAVELGILVVKNAVQQ